MERRNLRLDVVDLFKEQMDRAIEEIPKFDEDAIRKGLRLAVQSGCPNAPYGVLMALDVMKKFGSTATQQEALSKISGGQFNIYASYMVPEVLPWSLFPAKELEVLLRDKARIRPFLEKFCSHPLAIAFITFAAFHDTFEEENLLASIERENAKLLEEERRKEEEKSADPKLRARARHKKEGF